MKILLTIILYFWVSITYAFVYNIDVPFYFYGKEEPQWERIESLLMNSYGDTIRLYWKGDGGYIENGMKFVHALSYSQKYNKIEFIVTGQAVSTHALVLCYSNNVRLTNSAVLVFHGSSIAGYNGKIYMKEYIELFEPCIQKGYITTNDLYQMFYRAKRINVYPNHTKITLPDWKNENLSETII